MASPFTVLGILSKSRRANTIAQRVNATSKRTQDGQKQSSKKSDESSGRDSGSSESLSSSRILDDNAVLVDEPTYTVIPKSDQKTDIEQEWTDVGVDGKEKSRATKASEDRMLREIQEKEEERKRKEEQEREEERKKRDEEEERLAEEERKREDEEHKKREERKRVEVDRREREERKRREEERRRKDEEERRRRDEEERRRREEEERRKDEEERRRKEEKKKREESERRMRENYEAATRIREDRAREEERVRQETIRAQERQKLEGHIRRQDEKEQTLQEQLSALENEQHAGAIQIRELMKHSEHLEDQNTLLKSQLQRQSDEVRALKSQVYDSPNQITRFLSIGVAKSGKSVEQELVSLLDVLNSEVYQASACLADLLESRGQATRKSATRAAAEETRVVKMLGQGMTDVLKAKIMAGADLDPLVVQVALQMCMNHCCAKIIESWCPGMWNYSEFLSTLFTSIEASEDLAAANKWRAVTHAQFRQNDNMRTSMTRYVSENIKTLLAFIGLPNSSSDWVTELLEERCPMIVGPALHMNNAIFEDTAGESLEVVVVRPGEIYDVVTMENSYQDGEDDMYAGLVVATTDLGLRRTPGDYKGQGSIIKPKVILSSAFDAETRRVLERSR